MAVLHRSGWVLIDAHTIVTDGYVRVDGGRITAVGSGGRRANGAAADHQVDQVFDHGPGVLMPAVVNAHTHLELSALKDKISDDIGFRPWVKRVLQLREALGPTALLDAAAAGIAQLWSSGCAVAGEVSTLGLTGKAFAASGLDGVWFREFLGSTIDAALRDYPLNGDRTISVAGHAPHTTSPEVFARLKQMTRRQNTCFSVHLSESEDEVEFITTGRGPWADFLNQRGIDFSGWGIPARTPLAHLAALNVLDAHTLAVHLVHLDGDDMQLLQHHRPWVCLCPRSNQRLHQRLADACALDAAGIDLCLGTDSLASTPSLSIFDEMAFLAARCPSLAPEKIVAMATLNGARALGVSQRWGSLTPGKQGRMVYLPMKAATAREVLEQIVQGNANPKMIG